MARTGTKQTDTALQALRARIDHWRRTRTKRTSMPDDLWEEAASLCEDRGIYAVSRGVGLSYDRLKLHMVEAELERARRPVDVETADCRQLDDVAAGFVELRAAQVFSLPERTTVAAVELSRADGARMTLRLASEQSLDLIGLSETFLGGGR